MELESYEFPLLTETLNYLNDGVTGRVINIVRNKNNTFFFHLSLDKGEQLNNEEINLALLKKDVIPFSSVHPGLLLGCLHPLYKKWMRCYVVSVVHQQALVALCDTGEMTKTNKLKEIPDDYKRIPAITFEAEIKCICPHGKLRHLMENYKDYKATFESFINKSNIVTYKKMKLIYKNSSLDFIIKKWNVQNCMNSENFNFNSLFKNGSAVVLAKKENYDWRHVFVRSVDKFVNVSKDLQTYCMNVLNIQKNPIVGDIVAVKCMDKFYRSKIIDILDQSCFSLYLIDIGYIISASIECIVDLPDDLKTIPPTVCLVGLKDISLKPWTHDTSLYISTLFENSTTMILEYDDHDPFGLDSVTLTVINNNEDVNENLRKLLILVEDSQNDILNPVHDLSQILKSNNIIPVKMENLVKSGPHDLSKPIETCLLSSGSVVYMTGFIDLTEIYIRKIEDHNDDLEALFDMVNSFCQSAEPINRPLIIGEIVGALSTLDGSFYRGKVLKKNDTIAYLIQFIDFGDVDNVPLTNIFEIPKDFMTPSNVMAITLKGVKSCPLNTDTLNYITNLLSNYEPMIIDFSPEQPLKEVTLTIVNSNENVNEQLNKLLNNVDNTSPTKVIDQFATVNVDNYETVIDNVNLPKLKNGDLVNITTFIDVHHIFVRKVDDETDEFFNFIESVNLYCSSEKPIGKLPKLNDIIGAKSITDECFYRAKVIKKINDACYNVQFIDYGIQENVSLSDIVPLSAELKQFIPSTIMVQLKDVPFSVLNEAAHKYVSLLSENETLIISDIEEITNNVILKTEKNENVNEHLNFLIFGSLNKKNFTDIIQTEKIVELESQVQSEFNDISLLPGSVVYMTGFVDLNEMYIRKMEDYNDEFHNFLDKVNEFCSSASSINRSLVIGEIVGAQSTLDDSFYRGKVLKKINDSTYLIQYIDFGDFDNVPVSNIFEIPKDFMIPSTVIKISLKGIKSSCVMSVEASNYITDLLSTYEPLTIHFDPKFSLKDVTLTIIKSNENVNENLNKLLKDIESINANKSNTAVENKYVTEVEPLIPQDVMKSNNLYNETNILKNGDFVYITAYIDLFNIYVRKVDNNIEFQELIEKVNSYCSMGNNSGSKPPLLNEIVGAKSSADGYFYRARIKEIYDEKNYDTVFIDFGFEENVNITDIVPLSIQLQQVVPSIYLVGLKGSNFEHLNSEGHTYLENLISLGEIMKIDIEDLNAVTLTLVSKDQNVVEYLNKLHIGYSITDNTIINNSLKSASGMKYISNDISIPLIPPLINKCIVTIHAFVSLKDIYVSVPFNVSEVNKFIKDFSVFCSTRQLITRNPIVGDIFGIKSNIDGSYKRGIIKEKLNGNQYKVLFFDLGTEDIVPSNSFVEIPDRLKEVPRTIYVIGLKDIHAENLNAQAMSYVNTLCDNLPLIIEFDENDPNGLNSVTLTVIQTKQNVNHHLAKLLTDKERDSPETVQILSKGDIVYISTFEDLQAIYVRRINNGTDKFKSFLENFSSSCALENPIEKDPKIGEVIAVKEKNGSKFYRAEVISKVDDEHFNVRHIDFGSRDIVHKNNIVQPSELQLLNCPPTFVVGLDGFNSEPLKALTLQYIEKIIQTETFLIESITEQNKVILVSVNSQCNINDELKKLMANDYTKSKIKKDIIYTNEDIDTDSGKSVIQYYKPPLEVPIQVWVAEKISTSRYTVHTYDTRIEFMQLEKQIFEDSKTLKPVKSVKTNMPCIIYFSPSWYRGEILEVIDEETAKVNLIDVGNFSVIRNIKEIFCIPLKYVGKSLLLTIDIEPEPQETLSTMTFKIIAKKYLENSTIVELSEAFADQSYYDLDNVGLPSFSSTPIPEDLEQFKFGGNGEPNSNLTTFCNKKQQTSPNSIYNSSDKQSSNMLTIKDVQHAKWLKGSSKTLTFLCMYQDCFMMRDHMIDDTLTDLEQKIQDYCMTITESYAPVENELCLAKYCDEMWYRAVCLKTTACTLKENNYMVYFLDWGIEYMVNSKSIYKMNKDFAYLPATAHKCYIKGVVAAEWGSNTIDAVSQYMLTQVNCEILDKLTADSYMISCETLKTWVDAHLP